MSNKPDRASVDEDLLSFPFVHQQTRKAILSNPVSYGRTERRQSLATRFPQALIDYVPQAEPRILTRWKELQRDRAPAAADPQAWLDAAFEEEHDHAALLFRLANFFLLDSGVIGDCILDANVVLATTFHRLHYHRLGIAVIEQFLAANFDCDKDVFESRMRSAFAALPPEWSLSIVGILAGCLREQGRRHDAICAVECCLGIRGAVYTDIETHEHLRSVFRSHLPLLLSRPVRVLADGLIATFRPRDAAVLLEEFLGFGECEYASADLRSELAELSSEHVLGAISLNNLTSLVDTLAFALQTQGRYSDALSVREAWLGVQTGTYDTQHLEERLRQLGSPTRWQNTIIGLLDLSQLLRHLGRGADSLRLWDTFFTCVTSPGHGWLSGLMQRLLDEGLFPLQLFVEFIEAFRQQNGSAATLQFLEYQFRRLTTYEGGNLCHVVVHALRSGPPAPNEKARALTCFAEMLVDCEHFEQAAQVLKDGIDIPHCDFASLPIDLALRFLGEHIEPAVMARYVSIRLNALEAVGQHIESDQLLRAWWDRFQELRSNNALPADQIAEHMVIWLGFFGKSDWPNFAAECRATISYLRSGLRSRNAKLEDRVLLVRSLPRVRDAIVALGRFHAQSGPIEEAGSRRVQILLWQQELSDRLAAERLALTASTTVRQQRLRQAESPTPDWPFADADDRQETVSPRPAQAERPWPKFSRRPRPATPDDWQVRAEAILERGIDERNLATSLGEDTLLLQFGRGITAGVEWSAFWSDGNALRHLGTRIAGSRNNAATRLQIALTLHALRARLAVRNEQEYDAWFASRREALILLRDRIHTRVSADDEPLVRHAIDSFSQGGQFDPSSVSSSVWDAFLAQTLDLERKPASELQQLCHLGSERASVWKAVANELIAAANADTSFETATTTLLAELNKLFDLESLQDCLDPQTTHVVIQSDATCQAIPFEYLDVAGEPLFQRARAIRYSFSIFFESMQMQLDRAREVGHGDEHKLLVASWFPTPRDGLKIDTRGLHQQLKDTGLTYFGLAENPRASRTALMASLHGQAYDVVVVCGHGRNFGVELAADDGLRETVIWQGNGSDLGGVGFLIVISCGLGDVRPRQLQDFEGFCIEQAVCRGRSALACLWPVAADDAIRFGGEVARAYAMLVRDSNASHCQWPRAEALNRTRKLFYNSAKVGLNTAAAFRLIGFG